MSSKSLEIDGTEVYGLFREALGDCVLTARQQLELL